jgi:hypothetical protein
MNVTRLPVHLAADARRVIARPFNPGGPSRIRAVIDRVRAFPDTQVSAMLTALVTDYRQRHKDIRGIFRQNYATMSALAGEGVEASEDRPPAPRGVLHERVFAGVGRPVQPVDGLAPDQNGLPRGTIRFVMSLRACGKAISSIAFAPARSTPSGASPSTPRHASRSPRDRWTTRSTTRRATPSSSSR